MTCAITCWEEISHQGLNYSIMYLYYHEGKIDQCTLSLLSKRLYKVLVKCSKFGARVQSPVCITYWLTLDGLFSFPENQFSHLYKRDYSIHLNRLL